MDRPHDAHSRRVADYYDTHTDHYLKTYGPLIQAYRPTRDRDLLDHTIQATGMERGQQVLDAGCGVGGPALYFAQHAGVSIDGVTISAHQVEHAERLARELGVENVRFQEGDYHELDALYPADTFDHVLFLESLGHAVRPATVIEAAWTVLRPGGRIYIKDFFPFDIEDEELAARHRLVIDRIDQHYCYNTLDLVDTLRALRRRGFAIDFIRQMPFTPDITKRFTFEELLDVDLFGDMDEFRVAEWLEIRCTKPEFPLF